MKKVALIAIAAVLLLAACEWIAFLNKASMQFRPPLGNVVPAYIIELDQKEVDELWFILRADDCHQVGPLKSLTEKIEKYRSGR